MDAELEKRVTEVLNAIRAWSDNIPDYQSMDPVIKMMLVALAYESQKIQDSVDGIAPRILDKYCEDFIPWSLVGAIPSIAVVSPEFKDQKMVDCVTIGDGGSSFVGKKDKYSWLPVFKTRTIPLQDCLLVSPGLFRYNSEERPIQLEQQNVLWIGLNTAVELDSLKGLSLLFHGTKGVAPERILVGRDHSYELATASMDKMEDIEMLEPFDSQQSSPRFFSVINAWKEAFDDLDNDLLIYVTDSIRDRDLFKSRSFPRVFQYYLESDVIDLIKEGTLWIQAVFPEGYVVPDDCEVIVNAVPVVNVDINAATLTQSAPIVKLQRTDDSFFLGVAQTSNSAASQGFPSLDDEVIIRDFDAACYHSGDLFRDVRNLYNHFVEDYYAFVEFNGIKDGELIRQLRETVNKIGKSVGTHNSRYSFDSGTFAMKNMSSRSSQSSVIRLTYLTTKGRAGNSLCIDDVLESKKLTSVSGMRVVVPAMCGRDKLSFDERYETLRYYTMTQDRLYTKMDIDAFLRKEIMATFGKEEFHRIDIKIRIAGAGGESSLCRALYVDLSFRDKKNYDKAVSESFAIRTEKAIRHRSCISIPIFLTLINLEKH